MSVEEIKADCLALWRIAHATSASVNPIDQALAQMFDKQAIELAKSIGLNYGDFDHEKCTSPPTAEDEERILGDEGYDFGGLFGEAEPKG